MPARHHAKGRPVHEAEARGIHRLVSGLPDNYVVYSNIELPTGIRGQTYEHDAVVVAPHGVFTVELKSWGGTITGNRDRWTLVDGTFVQSPLPLLLSKARSLKGRLLAMRRDFVDVWVQGLVFLSAGDAVPHITPEFAPLVCTSSNMIDALKDPKAFSSGRPLLPGQVTAIHQFLDRRDVMDELRWGRSAGRADRRERSGTVGRRQPQGGDAADEAVNRGAVGEVEREVDRALRHAEDLGGVRLSEHDGVLELRGDAERAHLQNGGEAEGGGVHEDARRRSASSYSSSPSRVRSRSRSMSASSTPSSAATARRARWMTWSAKASAKNSRASS